MTGFFRFLLVSLAFTLGTINLSHAASFDCSKATTETEIAICNDPELSLLDQRMSNAYLKARGSNLGEHFKQHQLNWIKTRDLCFSNAECLKDSYEEILLVLKDFDYERLISTALISKKICKEEAEEGLSSGITAVMLRANQKYNKCAEAIVIGLINSTTNIDMQAISENLDNLRQSYQNITHGIFNSRKECAPTCGSMFKLFPPTLYGGVLEELIRIIAEANDVSYLVKEQTNSEVINLPAPDTYFDFVSAQDLEINFRLNDLPKNYEVTGTFSPKEWCRGNLLGNASVRVKNTQSGSNNLLKVDNFGLLTVDDFDRISSSSSTLQIDKNFEISYTHDDDPLGDKSIKILDFDYDQFDEIIFRKPCGMRHGTDFVAFEIANGLANASADQAEFEFTSMSRFNKENKTLSVWYSNGVCLGQELIFKGGTGSFKLIKKVQYERQSPQTNEEGCYEAIYKIDNFGMLLLEKLSKQNAEGDFVQLEHRK